MYENNENELEIYFTPETRLFSSSQNSDLTNMNQNLRPDYLRPGSDDHDRTHGRVDSWYNLDGGLELEEVTQIPRPDADKEPFIKPLQRIDSDEENTRMPEKAAKPKLEKKKSKIPCILICCCIVLGVSVPLGVFFGPELINFIMDAINGTNINGI